MENTLLTEIMVLREKNAELAEMLQNIANLLEVDARISVESIKCILNKYNHLSQM